MKNWAELNISEQINIVVEFIKTKRQNLTIAEQCSLGDYLFTFAQRVRYGNTEPTLFSVRKLSEILIEDGFEEWYQSDSHLVNPEFDNIHTIFWREGWIVTSNGLYPKVERIDDVIGWAHDNDLNFIPNQLENDLDAVELAKKYGFEFDDRINPTRITKPYFKI